jgi:hypothetical protein
MIFYNTAHCESTVLESQGTAHRSGVNPQGPAGFMRENRGFHTLYNLERSCLEAPVSSCGGPLPLGDPTEVIA